MVLRVDRSHGLPEGLPGHMRLLLLMGCTNHHLRLLVPKYSSVEGRRKAALGTQLPGGELPVGAAAECVGRTARPESCQRDLSCASTRL